MATTRIQSTQDGIQETGTLVTSRTRLYRDMDLAFEAKPNGEIYVLKDAAAVTQALKNLMQTNYFDKPFNPFFGANLRAMLFELADEDTDELLKNQIIRAIKNYEPRANLIRLDVDLIPDRNDLLVTIEYQVVNSTELVKFTTTVQRLR